MDPINKLSPIFANMNITSNYEVDLAKAKNGESLPACKRLALHICRVQAEGKTNDAFELATKSSLRAGVARAAGNISPALKQAPTHQEVAILYDKFLRLFELMQMEQKKPTTLKELPIRWRVDYSPEGPLREVLEIWHRQIEQARKTVNGPQFPSEWGLPMKTFYDAKNGCATVNDSVIANDGSRLQEDPWAIFYRTNDPADEARAKDLMPKMGRKMHVKFYNRTIVQTMNYTFEQHALMLLQNGFNGLVCFLIKSLPKPLPQEMGYSLLHAVASQENSAVCRALFRANLAPYTQQEGSEEPFLRMIRKWSASNLLEALGWFGWRTDYPVKLAQHPERCQEIPYHLALRYSSGVLDGHYEDKFFRALCSQLYQVYVPNEERDYNSFVREFATAILQTADKYRIVIHPTSKEWLGNFSGRSSYVPTAVRAINDDAPMYTTSTDEVRKVVRTMGYTFNQHAEEAVRSRAWNILYELIVHPTGGAIDLKIAAKILPIAESNKEHAVCKALYAALAPSRSMLEMAF